MMKFCAKLTKKSRTSFTVNAKKPDNVAEAALLTNINTLNLHNVRKTPYLCTNHFWEWCSSG